MGSFSSLLGCESSLYIKDFFKVYHLPLNAKVKKSVFFTIQKFCMCVCFKYSNIAMFFIMTFVLQVIKSFPTTTFQIITVLFYLCQTFYNLYLLWGFFLQTQQLRKPVIIQAG